MFSIRWWKSQVSTNNWVTMRSKVIYSSHCNVVIQSFETPWIFFAQCNLVFYFLRLLLQVTPMKLQMNLGVVCCTKCLVSSASLVCAVCIVFWVIITRRLRFLKTSRLAVWWVIASHKFQHCQCSAELLLSFFRMLCFLQFTANEEVSQFIDFALIVLLGQ